MARLTRETARRSINALLDKLPRDAAVELTSTGEAPRGVAAVVKIEISEPPCDLEAAEEDERTNEDIQG